MSDIARATPDDLDDILMLFSSVQLWLAGQGLAEQWGDEPFSSSPSQRERFAAWLDAGDFYVIRPEGSIVATLVLSEHPPAYARQACHGKPRGGYLEALAVHRDYAGQGLGSRLLAWAEEATVRWGFELLRLSCWAGNEALRAYYRRAGFREASKLHLGTWHGVLFEKRLKVLP